MDSIADQLVRSRLWSSRWKMAAKFWRWHAALPPEAYAERLASINADLAEIRANPESMKLFDGARALARIEMAANAREAVSRSLKTMLVDGLPHRDDGSGDWGALEKRLHQAITDAVAKAG